MNNYKLIFEEYACWGCKACEVACKQEYNPPPYGAYDPKGADAVKYVSVWGDGPKVVDGKLDFMWRVNVCKHCVEPPCAVSCPEGAITKDPKTGIVLHDKDKCNGCNAIQGKSGVLKQRSSGGRPAHNNIQGCESAAKGRYQEAQRSRRQALPSICGRVCYHLRVKLQQESDR
jgi:ferredoxin